MTNLRFRRWVYRRGSEPDPRFSLANERTFLAWMRTGLALLAGAVALDAVVGDAHAHVLGHRHLLVRVFVVAGAGSAVLGFSRWALAESALRRGRRLPSLGPAAVGAAGVLIGCALTLLLSHP
jgi:putative membrane protein